MQLAASVTGSVSRQPSSARAMRLWLLLVAFLVLVMVGVGGATRLTGSGLSITEWQPIMGAVPPLSDAEWQDAFAKYKAIPQYQRVNKGMSLGEFKEIFWWEWSHRLLGRLIGVVFAVPLVWFWWRGALSAALGWRLLGLFALGGLQGFVGWYMVQSGLVERVSVSQYRLALHLGLAFAIFALLLWIALDTGQSQSRRITLDTVPSRQRRLADWLLALVFVQVFLGALVAGLKAGLTYNTWPLMDGMLVPDGLFSMSPWYVNPFENITMVQFDHRVMAYVLVGLAAWHAIALARTADDERVVRSAWLLLLAMVAQAALGIWTLLSVVPLHLGIAHQTGAVIVLAIAVWHRHRMVRP
jgi:cytochrome c oxidase assembly protein subunit 15